MVFNSVQMMIIHFVTPYVSTFVNKPPRFVTYFDSQPFWPIFDAQGDFEG